MADRIFKALKSKVSNRGTPSDEFLNTLIDVLLKEPDSTFEINPNIDIYSSVRAELGPYTSLLQRKAVMAECLRVLAGMESSWNWSEGRDVTNPNSAKLYEQEAGIFQCSPNSVYLSAGMKALFKEYTGFNYWNAEAACSAAFIEETKTNPEYAIKHCMLVLRETIRHHGPVRDRTMHRWLKKEAVREFMDLFDAELVPGIPDDAPGYMVPPKPKNYTEVKKIFGNPDASDWAAKNLGWVMVGDAYPKFPKKNGTYGFYANRKLVPLFEAVFTEITELGLAKLIKTFDGCYNNRNIGGSKNKSLHAWAIAIDINAADNSWGDTTPALDKRIVAVFKKHGFYWGGDFKSKKDGMHFEWYSR